MTAEVSSAPLKRYLWRSPSFFPFTLYNSRVMSTRSPRLFFILNQGLLWSIFRTILSSLPSVNDVHVRFKMLQNTRVSRSSNWRRRNMAKDEDETLETEWLLTVFSPFKWHIRRGLIDNCLNSRPGTFHFEVIFCRRETLKGLCPTLSGN